MAIQLQPGTLETDNSTPGWDSMVVVICHHPLSHSFFFLAPLSHASKLRQGQHGSRAQKITSTLFSGDRCRLVSKRATGSRGERSWTPDWTRAGAPFADVGFDVAHTVWARGAPDWCATHGRTGSRDWAIGSQWHEGVVLEGSAV